MYTSDCIDFLNKVPGFYADSPTQGHIAIHSAYWVGKVIYYPAKGVFDISNAKGNEALESLSTSEGIPLIVLLRVAFTHDNDVLSILKAIC